jgi:RNA polymerase sigma-70 factor, ECF subfamily
MNCDVPALWIEYKDRLFSFIKKRVNDLEDAKDLHHDVLMKVYKFCQTKSGVKKIDSWLYQIAHNTIVDYYKRKERKFEPEIEDFDENDSPLISAIDYIVPLIGLIPKEYGEPLMLSDIQNLKQKEIAEKMGLSLTATKSRIHRARVLLKKEFSTCFAIQYGSDGEISDMELKNDCKPLQEINYKKKNL